MIRKSKNHLEEVDETYLKHMVVNFKTGILMLITGIKFLVHGIIPALFKNAGKEDDSNL